MLIATIKNAVRRRRIVRPLALLVGAAMLLAGQPLAGQDQPSPRPLQAPVQGKEARRLSAVELENLHRMIKPQAGESRWMEISWHPNIWEARQKAAALGKPLFIWAGSGGAPAAGC